MKRFFLANGNFLASMVCITVYFIFPFLYKKMSRTSNSMAIINTRLNINGCTLSSRKFLSPAPLFLNVEDTEIRVSLRFSKKIRARCWES
jgi:hypothetical protein